MTAVTRITASGAHVARRRRSGGPAVVDVAFRAMGCDVRISAVSDDRDQDDLAAAVGRAEQLVHAAAARLTRFDPASELRRLDADPSPVVSVSPLLAHAVDVARRAAHASGGLLDPTLPGPLATVGYAGGWDPARWVDLGELLAHAPRHRPARPAPSPESSSGSSAVPSHRAAGSWHQLHVDRVARQIRRPPGMRLDLGATAKGLIADLALRRLGATDGAFVDAGGDIARSGDPAADLVLAADPFGGAPVPLQCRGAGGVATSSIAGRCWIGAGGVPAHHLLDPSTQRPAFTGVVQATAAAPCAAHAERLAGQALLSGPAAGALLLARYGGLLVLDDATTLRLPGALLR